MSVMNGVFAVILVVVLLLFAGLIIGAIINLGFWAKHDAEERGMDSPVVWGLVVALVPNLLGLIIYLVVRSTQGVTRPCLQCGRPIKDPAQYCPACGSDQYRVQGQNQYPYPQAEMPKHSKTYLRNFVALFIASIAMMIIMVIAAVIFSL